MANFKKIKQLAKQRGVSLHDIAHSIGITPTGLSTIIRKNSTSQDTLYRLCKYFNVPIEFFLADDYDYGLLDKEEKSNTPAERVRAELQERRWSLRELGEKIGMSQQRLWYILNSASSIKEEDLKKIADALGVPIEKLHKPSGEHSVRLNIPTPGSGRLPRYDGSIRQPTSLAQMQQQIDMLQQQLTAKDQQIANLMQIIETISRSSHQHTYQPYVCNGEKKSGDPF